MTSSKGTHTMTKSKDTAESDSIENEASEETAPAVENAVAETTIEEQLVAKEKEARDNWDRFVRERADLETIASVSTAKKRNCSTTAINL